jgi:hypothetical protein
MIEKEFVPYEEALTLKELGFNESCLASYFHAGKRLDICEYINHGEYTVLAPTFSQAFRWFRENYNIDISINTVYSKYNENTSKKYGGVIDNESVFTNVGFHDTYEEAEIVCLKKLIEIVK